MGELLARSSPTPFQELLHNNYLNRVVSARIDSRRERTARFCCRERLSTTKTPAAKRVVWRQNGMSRAPSRKQTYFLERRRAKSESPLPPNFNVHRRGDSLFARFFILIILYTRTSLTDTPFGHLYCPCNKQCKIRRPK